MVAIFRITLNSRPEIGFWPIRIESMNSYIEDVRQGYFPQFLSSKSNDHAIDFYVIGAYLGSFLNYSGKDVFALLEFIFILTAIIICTYIVNYISKNFS